MGETPVSQGCRGWCTSHSWPWGLLLEQAPSLGHKGSREDPGECLVQAARPHRAPQ